ncbi:MAG: hypothetical protein RBR35_10460 [Salinivirgaceae bacterium]|nr:hypothetical protein [Salinivirgaceae bacterium]
MEKMLFYETPAFTIIIVVYTVMGLLTAVGCYRKSKKMNKSTFEWTLLGYFLPILAYIFLSRQSINS